ncbi:MAG: leucine-rich repeat domain-containing protein [Treponema sp.]|nr:leucine-rich repeat domain-containing protein [Treponema sp.]
MKKNVFLAGMAALALVFGLVLAGCPEDPPDDPFNTPETPDTVLVEAVNIGPDDDRTSAWGNAFKAATNSSRYVILDLSRCTFTDNTVTGSFNGDRGMNIFKSKFYVIGIILPQSVTSIGTAAFCDCYNLTSVSIPSNVISIGQYAFRGCSGLTGITIPASVTSIGQYAFSGCSGLSSITIPAGVTSIEERAFSDTSLTSVTIPAGVTSIGSYAFSGTALTGVSIPANVTSIGNSAFSGTALTSVSIPANVTSIGNFAFSGCTALTSVTFAEGSNIADANFGSYAFPQGEDGDGGNTLKTAYSTGRAGTYTRPANGDTWT